MTKALLTAAVAAAVSVAFPAFAQPGPGIAPAPSSSAPAVQSQPGPGIGAPSNGATLPGHPALDASTARKPSGPPVYDEAADAKAVVASAVAKARRENKRVLVTLGANWCGWCRSLDRLLARDEKIAAALAKSYVPVKVDVGRMTKNLDLAATWGADPKKGVPLLVVLDGSGKAVKVQETGAFEVERGHDPVKVAAFLESNAGR